MVVVTRGEFGQHHLPAPSPGTHPNVRAVRGGRTVSVVSSQIDLIYDRLIAEDKLKDGTKYERLAAIAFCVLTGRDTVHDLRLRGASGVQHQIDAVVGEDRKRILVETKDYDRVIGLPIIRNFWGAVEDIGPDEAFIVTTVGFTKPAIRYGEAKGIRLALLRPPDEEDWQGVCRKVVLDIVMTGQAGLASVTWQLHPDDRHKIDGDSAGLGVTETAQLKLAVAEGAEHDFLPMLDAQLTEDYGKVPLGGEATIGRFNTFDEPTWLIAPGIPPLRVEAWKWEVKVGSDTTQVIVGEGVGGLVAELALRTVDGSIRRMFTNRQLEAWTFNGHNVLSRNGSTDR